MQISSSEAPPLQKHHAHSPIHRPRSISSSCLSTPVISEPNDAMAEQLILKGTLEGHVRCPFCSQGPCWRNSRMILTVDIERLGHQLGHLDGEVRLITQFRPLNILWRTRDDICRTSLLTVDFFPAPTCSCLLLATRPSSSGTSLAMSPSTDTPSARSTVTLTSSPTAYVQPPIDLKEEDKAAMNLSEVKERDCMEQCG